MARTRRRFLQEAAALAASGSLTGTLIGSQPAPARLDRVRVAVIGVDGQGAYNMREVHGTNLVEIVALCDVAETRAVEARKRFPKARFYTDYRRLLEQKDIQAVVVATPDHHHAFATVAALRSGRHVYCEKPLTHSVHEGRVVMETAARNKLVTQMGTQIHALENYRRVVEIVQAGVLGPIQRVHVWCSRRPDSGQRARKETPPPRGLHYDLWLGPAPARPYHESHLHFNWRWWWDFGGGVLADMGCHFMDLPHWALNLGSPTSIAATGRVEHKGDNGTMPDFLQVDYEYPARGDRPAVRLTWYHGVEGPDLSGKVRHAGFPSGVLFEGAKGSLVSHYTDHRLLPEDRFRDFTRPPATIPRSIGHHREWVEAIRRGGTTTCNFAYSGLVSEAVLLGNVAYRAGARLNWDGKTGRVTNSAAKAAAQYLQREYRRGWTL
jgi:predicted dehydrogenase